MAAKDCGTEHVCKLHFRALLVGGFLAPREEVEEAAWTLCKRLFNFSERQREEHYSTVKSLVNSARRLGDIPTYDVEQIMTFVAAADTCEDGITTAVFAHSHGAKLVEEALQDKTFIQFIQTNFDYHEERVARERLQAIRRNLLVITFGGITKISEDFAKVVANLRLSQDVKAFFGEKLYGEKDDGDKRKVLVLGPKEHLASAWEKAGNWLNSAAEWLRIRRNDNSSGSSREENDEDESDQLPGNSLSTKPTTMQDANRTTPSESRRQDKNLAEGVDQIATGEEEEEEEGKEKRSPSSSDEWLQAISIASTGGAKHVLREYTLDEETMSFVIACLSLDKDVKCACVLSPEPV